jgi:hypothetical protein
VDGGLGDRAWPAVPRPRELLSTPEWSGELRWVDRHSSKRRGHRPDLDAFLSDQAIPIEVELANKSKTRLDAILKLHLRWIIARKSAALIYICGDEEGCRRIERGGHRVGLHPTSRSLPILITYHGSPATLRAPVLATRLRAERRARRGLETEFSPSPSCRIAVSETIVRVACERDCWAGLVAARAPLVTAQAER